MTNVILFGSFVLACLATAIIFGQCVRIGEPHSNDIRKPWLAWWALCMLILNVITILFILVPHW